MQIAQKLDSTESRAVISYSYKKMLEEFKKNPIYFFQKLAVFIKKWEVTQHILGKYSVKISQRLYSLVSGNVKSQKDSICEWWENPPFIVALNIASRLFWVKEDIFEKEDMGKINSFADFLSKLSKSIDFANLKTASENETFKNFVEVYEKLWPKVAAKVVSFREWYIEDVLENLLSFYEEIKKSKLEVDEDIVVLGIENSLFEEDKYFFKIYTTLNKEEIKELLEKAPNIKKLVPLNKLDSFLEGYKQTKTVNI